MMLDGPRAVLLAVLGVPGGSGGRGGGGMPQLQPSFEQPYRSHSLKEFWGVRYNKVIGSLLRDVVYEPVLQGQLVYDGARRSGSDGVDGGNAAAGAVHAGGEVVQTKQDASGAQQGERTPSDVANSNRELVSTAGAKRRQAGSSRSDGTAAVVARSVSDSSFNSNVGACVMNWAAVMSTGDSTDDSSGGGGGAALRARSVASKNDAAAKGLEQEEKQKQEEETKVNESDGGGVRRRRCAHLRARSLSAVDIVAAVSADVVDGPPSPQAARSALAATEHGSGRQDSENDNAKTASAREVVAVLGQPAAAAASAEHHRRPGSSKLRQTLATAAVFVVSGVMHEVLLVYMCGYATGKMFAFFALQAPAVMLEAQVLGAVPPAWLRRTDVQWLQVCMTWLTIMGMAEWLFWVSTLCVAHLSWIAHGNASRPRLPLWPLAFIMPPSQVCD